MSTSGRERTDDCERRHQTKEDNEERQTARASKERNDLGTHRCSWAQDEEARRFQTLARFRGLVVGAHAYLAVLIDLQHDLAEIARRRVPCGHRRSRMLVRHGAHTREPAAPQRLPALSRLSLTMP